MSGKFWEPTFSLFYSGSYLGKCFLFIFFNFSSISFSVFPELCIYNAGFLFPFALKVVQFKGSLVIVTVRTGIPSSHIIYYYVTASYSISLFARKI